MRQTLTYWKENSLEFPMLLGHNLHFQWTLDKQNEAMNWYKGSLMGLSNMRCTFKSLSEGRSDSLKEHLALGMKQLGSETEYFREYWRAKRYHLWDDLLDGSIILPVMLKHAGEKFEQMSCDWWLLDVENMMLWVSWTLPWCCSGMQDRGPAFL